MGTVTLLLAIHNHQPQGNFDHVFAQGYDDCYRPFLEAVARHPQVRLSLHCSGPLIEWLEQNHPDYFDTLAELVRRGQVEMLGGGMYEPMLSVLPERDALGQLGQMAEFLEGRVGQRPTGMWLAERVWEPDLTRIIARSGYRYTVLDDGHFLTAGMRRPLDGYYLTDKAGLPLCLFPISMPLRYAIPFKPAGEVIELLRQLGREAGERNVVVTYGDDGEKFGLWPGTKSWVWGEGWLEKFFSSLEQECDSIQTSTFSDALRRFQPHGRVYLPTTSYDEMGEWSLPTEAQERFAALHQALKEQGSQEEWGPFVRGGIWQGFLAKYPESNFMHKRMCYVSDKVARAAAQVGENSERAVQKALQRATGELYRGQCNCAYWHGLFGGLYLAKLRSAIHGHLIRADVEASSILGQPQPLAMERQDLDADLAEEVILASKAIGAMVAPTRGGALLALDDRKRAFCVTDVLTRRPEAYHAKVKKPRLAAPVAETGAPQSIHEITELKEQGLEQLLIYDGYQRLAFIDQFLPAGVTADQLRRCAVEDLSDLRLAPYQLLQTSGVAGHVMLGHQGKVKTGAGEVAIQLRKAFRMEDNLLTVEYELQAAAPLEGLVFCTEISLALPCGPHPTGQCLILNAADTVQESLTAGGTTPDSSSVELSDPYSGMVLTLLPSPPATVARFPLETVSQSESGIERTYQGTVFTFLWPCRLQAGQSLRPALSIRIA